MLPVSSWPSGFFRDPRSSTEILDDLDLFRNGSILNGALALFRQDPGRRHPQLRVRLAYFDEVGNLEDSRLLEGNIFVLIEQIQTFLRQYIPIAFGVIRDLKEERISRLRNPGIAHVLWLRGLIEGFGTGSGLILLECAKAGLPEPEWKAGAGGVSLTIRSSLLGEAVVHVDLNPRQQALLREVQPGARIDPSEYSKRFAAMISDRQARTDLSRLMDAGYLRREGKGPSTSYVRTTKR